MAKISKCTKCGKETGDLYWVSPYNGKPVDRPYCAECFEREFRRHIQEQVEDKDEEDTYEEDSLSLYEKIFYMQEDLSGDEYLIDVEELIDAQDI